MGKQINGTKCGFKGCTRAPRAHNLCQGHYMQERRGLKLTKLRAYTWKSKATRAAKIKAITGNAAKRAAAKARKTQNAAKAQNKAQKKAA